MKENKPVINPCFWMVGLLNRLVEGKLGGVLAWYTKKHTDQCEKCGPALKALLALRDGLKKACGEEAVGLSDDRWARIQAACDHAEGA
ncbi:MAG: hypothetical protein JSS66_15910 [Armatimonadetes bacterium]|nr:hypothetical protein [Armatimonadota bacterium]